LSKGDRRDRTLDRLGAEQRLHRFSDVVGRRFDPDEAALTEQAEGGGFVDELRRVRFQRGGRDAELGGAERLEQPSRERARLSLVGATEEIETSLRIGLVDDAAD
jgi:hypothetical protein